MGFLFLVISLIPYGLYGIKHGGFLGGIPSEEDAGEGTHGKTHDYTPQLNVNGPVSYELYGIGRSNAQYNSNDSAGNTEQYGLCKELVEYNSMLQR